MLPLQPVIVTLKTPLLHVTIHSQNAEARFTSGTGGSPFRGTTTRRLLTLWSSRKT